MIWNRNFTEELTDLAEDQKDCYAIAERTNSGLKEHKIVTVPGHGEITPDEEEQMIAFMEYLIEKRKKESER